MPNSTEVLRFALLQGPLRGLLHEPVKIVEPVATTSTLAPLAARGASGWPLPMGTHDSLDGAPYPAGRVAGYTGWDRLGRLLVAAFGLQRREPSNPANDHRVMASVRSRFPVHVFVLPSGGEHAGYLDVYRHALVNVAVEHSALATLAGTGDDVTVALAGRHTDFPAGYGALRCALADLEVGINLRSLLLTAQLFGIATSVEVDGTRIADAAGLINATGPGSWSAPVLVTLHGAGPLRPSSPLGGSCPGAVDPGIDELLRAELHDASLREIATIVSCRFGTPADTDADLPPGLDTPAGAIPDLPRSSERSWARVLWSRSAGRVSARLTGFSARPTVLDRGSLDELFAWASMPAPTAALREVGARVRLQLVLQRATELPDGRYTFRDGQAHLEELADDLPHRLERAFGYPLTAANDCAVRHSAAIWVYSVDLDALIADLGTAAWTQLQVWCGWFAHGLTIGAAARGLFARPARSFDENMVAQVMGMPRNESPVFMTICGRARYAEPMLDLRA